MIKGSIQQEEITIINVYALKGRAPNYVKQIFLNLKSDIDSNTIKWGP